ncbi:MAG: ATP--guanido phosphotransferase [Clostridiales bacterium]|nr:ATP--guanido phosphotransferase [Clostridiales bacterium]
MRNDIVLSSRVRLARNFEDIPFDVSQRPEFAAICISRTVNALKAAGVDGGFEFFRLRDMSDASRQAMAESRLISRDLLSTPESSAALVRPEDALSIMINEDDHLRIQCIRPEMDLLSAASACFRVDDALSRQVSFAFDEQLGYLTACPTNTGTGMRASLLMHLPLLTRAKKMGDVGQLVAKVGLNIRGVYGEGSDALGNIYQISNQVTLGRTEQELISTVTALGNQLCDMESALRDKAMQEGRIPLEDVVFRAWGALTNARLMPLNEFYQHWSSVRLGAALGLLKLPLALTDALLDHVQDAHLCVWAEEALTGAALNEARATRAREMLTLAP